jgi:hypothetical protein
MKTRTFEVPVDQMIDFAGILDEHGLNNTIQGTNDDAEIVVSTMSLTIVMSSSSCLSCLIAKMMIKQCQDRTGSIAMTVRPVFKTNQHGHIYPHRSSG